jgi:hypothetical protein
MSESTSLPIMLKAPRLPCVKYHYERVARQAEEQAWPYERNLTELVEQEVAERSTEGDQPDHHRQAALP